MPYTAFDLPAQFRIRSQSWRLDPGIIYQRSVFTGADKAVEIGPGARWQCEVELTPTRDLTDLRVRRAVMSVQNSINRVYRIPAVEVSQAFSPVPATCAVNGANQLGRLLACDGLPNSAAILSAGQMISVALANGSEQLFVLEDDAISNGSGQVTFVLGTPLRSAPADNATVRLHFPVSTMRITPAVAWTVQSGLVYDHPGLTAVEVF